MIKLKVALLFGGQSDEHQVSLISAQGILKNLDRDKYEVYPIGIDRQGGWYYYPKTTCLNPENPKTVSLHPDGIALTLDLSAKSNFFVGREQPLKLPRPDIIFPILHGPGGEDGSMQGLLQLAGIPYVGSDVLGSSLGMDKANTKIVLHAHQIPVGPFLFFEKHQQRQFGSWAMVKRQLGSDLFVKPANLGSSVGISHVKTQAAYQKAVRLAFSFDHKIMVEKTIQGRELEVAVLGNHLVKASLPGEICPNHDFYSYEAKYLDPHGASLHIPAPVKANVSKRLQQLAKASFIALGLRGLARIDFFYDEKKDALYVNEVNTMPGFTPISMYPKLWQQHGLGYSKLLDQLIQLGLHAHQA